MANGEQNNIEKCYLKAHHFCQKKNAWGNGANRTIGFSSDLICLQKNACGNAQILKPAGSHFSSFSSTFFMLGKLLNQTHRSVNVQWVFIAFCKTALSLRPICCNAKPLSLLSKQCHIVSICFRLQIFRIALQSDIFVYVVAFSFFSFIFVSLNVPFFSFYFVLGFAYDR